MPGFCTNCGNPVKAGVRFCQECGAQVKTPAAPPSLPVREAAQESVAKAPSASPHETLTPKPDTAPPNVQLLKPREIAVSLDIDASKSNKKILLIGSLSALVIIYIVGVVLYLHRNSNTDDTTIVSSIKAAFLNEVELSRSTIECTSEKGVVTLTGLVNSDTEKSNAIRLANTQRGVKQVLDHLIVASTSVASPNAQPTDASLSPGSPPLAGTSYPQPNLPTIPASAEIEAERLSKAKRRPAVTSQQQCIGAGDATVRNNTHGTIQIVSGTGAFAQIGSANKFLKVPAGVPLNGTVTLRALNNGPGFAVAPLIETLSWGTPQTSWGGIANLSPGESTFNSQINSRAPLEVGTYQILFAFQLEKTGANVASGTSWARGQDVWGDGNEIARFDALQIQEGQKFGCTIDPWLTQEGFQLFYVPADAITIEVGPPPAAPVQPSEINFRYVEDNPQNIDIHQVDFRNFSYQSDCSKQMGDGSNPVIRVSNGKWQKGNPDEGNMISFSIAKMMYGKLNGNGGEQVVVMTSCQGMSNFDFEEVFIFEMSSGIPKILAKLSPSDWGQGEQCSGANCPIRELHVSNQQLSLSFGVGGSSAQPAWLDTASFQWSANKFIRKGVTRKVLRGVN